MRATGTNTVQAFVTS